MNDKELYRQAFNSYHRHWFSYRYGDDPSCYIITIEVPEVVDNSIKRRNRWVFVYNRGNYLNNYNKKLLFHFNRQSGKFRIYEDVPFRLIDTIVQLYWSDTHPDKLQNVTPEHPDSNYQDDVKFVNWIF